MIDDLHHRDLADPEAVRDDGTGATALLRAAEAAFARRGPHAAFVVCPAAWRSEVRPLEAAGCQTAMTWMTRR